MSTNKKTWKNFEIEVARLFGAERTPLSGMAHSLTKADTLQPNLFIECKLRDKKHPNNTLYVRYRQEKEKTIFYDGDLVLMDNTTFAGLVSMLRENPKMGLKRIKLYYKFIEYFRKSVISLYEDTAKKAGFENTIPIVALRVKNKKGFLIVFEFNHLKQIVNEYRG